MATSPLVRLPPALARTLAALAGVWFALGCGAGCTDDESTREAAPSAHKAAAASRAPRIVSLTPSHTEILFALGVGDSVVGVTRFCDFPPEVSGIDKIGGYTDPSFEAVVALSPTLVVSEGGPGMAAFEERLRKAGLRVASVPIVSLADVGPGIERLGKAVGAESKAREVNAALLTGLRALQSKSPDSDRPRVLVTYGARPFVVAGPSTFAHDLVQLVGGRNVAGDATVTYPQWGIEQLVRAAPDVILDARMNDDGSAPWAGLDSIPAVRDGRVVRLQSTAAMRPGPRLVEAAREFAAAIAGSKP